LSVMSAPVLENDIDIQEPPLSEVERVFSELAEVELIAEDGIPLETNWHRIQMNLLIDSVHFLWKDRSDYFAGGNMFIYFNLEQARNRDYRGPDVFVVKDVDISRKRDYWAIWAENGRYPDVIVELSSSSTIDIDLGTKKTIYEKIFRTPEYYCYDPDKKKLLGWQRVKGRYEELTPNEKGWLYSEELGVWIGKWVGERTRLHDTWLRFYTEDNELVPTQDEFEAKRAENEAMRAEYEAKRAENEAMRAEKAEAELAHLREMLAKHGIKES